MELWKELVLPCNQEHLSLGHCEDEEVLDRILQYPSLEQSHGWNDVVGDGVNPKIRISAENITA